MINLIPSRDVRDYIRQTGRVYSDCEKATIIYNLGLSFETTKKELQKIADSTEDEVLKMQISEYIKYEKRKDALQEKDFEDMRYVNFNQLGFENAYIDIPNPFEKGDIVRLTTDGSHGIVSISQKEWQAYSELMRSTEYVDFSDASILVDFVTDSGKIVHNHICPMFSEKYEPAEDDKDCNILHAGSGVYTGNCGLDWFAICYDAYKDKCKIKERCNNVKK